MYVKLDSGQKVAGKPQWDANVYRTGKPQKNSSFTGLVPKDRI